MPTWDCLQNPALSLCCLHHLILPESYTSSLTIFLYSSWLYVLPYFLFFLFWLAFLCHVSVFVAIKVFWFSVLEVLIRLSNVHGLFLPSIGYSYASSIVILSLYGLISLPNWCDHHFLLLECLRCCYGWVSQYCLYDILLYVLLQ